MSFEDGCQLHAKLESQKFTLMAVTTFCNGEYCKSDINSLVTSIYKGKRACSKRLYSSR